MAGLLTLLVPPVLLSSLLIMERIESRMPPNDHETEEEDDFPTVPSGFASLTTAWL